MEVSGNLSGIRLFVAQLVGFFVCFCFGFGFCPAPASPGFCFEEFQPGLKTVENLL